jgi:hypothetical protein
VAVLMVSSAAAAQEPPPVPVFVTTAAAAQGFSDPSKERLDSVNDIKDKARKADKLLKLVDTRDEATIVLEVLDRGSQYKRTATGAIFGTPWGGQQKRSVTVRVTVGEYSSELTSEKGSYKDAAADVVMQLQRWVMANREKLMAVK